VQASGDLGAQRVRLAERRYFRQIARARRSRPGAHLGDQLCVRTGHKSFLRESAAEFRAAQIIGAPLEQRRSERTPERAGQQWDIARVQLVLQRARAGGDQHPQPRAQRGHQISKRLAGAGAGFHQQVLALRHGLRNPLGHATLCRTRHEAFEGARQHPARSEHFLHRAHGRRPK